MVPVEEEEVQEECEDDNVDVVITHLLVIHLITKY